MRFEYPHPKVSITIQECETPLGEAETKRVGAIKAALHAVQSTSAMMARQVAYCIIALVDYMAVNVTQWWS